MPAKKIVKEIHKEVKQKLMESGAEKCKFCGELRPVVSMHRHNDGYVCNDCWDERLRNTE